MKGKNRILSVLLVLMLLLTMLPVTAFSVNGTSESTVPQFSDMPDDWSTAALERAVENGLLTGSGGKIMPQDNLTRAQMAATITRAFGASVEGNLSDFSDVKNTDWFFSAMARAYQMKILNGTDGKMNPNAAITREEVFTILARALKLKDADTAEKTFPDAGSLSSWAKGPVYAMINAGYVGGSNGYINPKAVITRAEFAQLMDNTFKQYIRSAGTVMSIPSGNVMINAPGVILKDTAVTGDLIIGDGVGDGEVTLDNVTITGRLVVRGGGVNSVIIRGGSSVSTVVVSRVDGKVSVKVQGDADVEVIYIDDGSDDVQIEGTVGSLELAASGIEVSTVGATIGDIAVTGADSRITVDSNSTVGTIITSAPNTQISGTGTVTQVQARTGATGAKIETPKTEITVGAGVTGVTGGGGTAISGGTTVNNNSSGTGTTTPSAGYSGGGGGDDDSTPTLSVTSVSVTSATTVTFSCPAVPTAVTWNGTAVSSGNISYVAATRVATVTVPRIMTTANTMTVGASGYNAATVSVAVTQSAGDLILISNAGDLADAIVNQADGQVWIIKAGTYDLVQSELNKYKSNRYDATGLVETGGQTDWYFPITANDLLIKGEGSPTVTSSVVTQNGRWATQNFITVWGDDVMIDGIKIDSKTETNKSIEILGKNFTLKNVETIAKTYDDGTVFGGSLCFNTADVGNNVRIENVKLQAWISDNVGTVTAGRITLKNVLIDFRNNAYANYKWEGTRYVYGVIAANSVFVNDSSDGIPGLTVKADNIVYDIKTNVIDRVPAGSVVELAAGKYYVTAALERADITLDTTTNNAQIVVLPAGTVVIDSPAQLETALAGQAEGQTWLIERDEYPLNPHSAMSAGDFNTQTGWYFPILVDDLTIIGHGDPVLYGAQATNNGSWATQNLITVFGDNVTMKGLTIMPKVETNKSIEVVGDVKFTIEDCTFTPNTITPGAGAEKGGSLYFNGRDGSETTDPKNITVSGNVFNYTTVAFDGVEDDSGDETSGIAITGNTFQHIAPNSYAIGNTYWGSAGGITTQYADIHVDDNDFNNVTAGIKIIAARLNETFILSASNRINGVAIDKNGFEGYINFDNLANWSACKLNKVIVEDVTYQSPYADVDAYVTTAAGLMEAVANANADASSDDTILVKAGTYELSAQLKITTPLTIRGSGATIKPAASFASHPAETYLDNLIDIESVDGLVHLENLTVMNAVRSGINVVESTNVELVDIVSTDNTYGGGLIVNCSVVKAENFSTSGNAWGYGINIDRGLHPSEGAPDPSLTLTGDGVLAEALQIVSDRTEGVTVTAAGYTPIADPTPDSTKTYWTNRPVTLTRAAGGDPELYPIIQMAINAADSNDTIVLGADISGLDERLVIDESITLDGDGYTLSFMDAINTATYGTRHGICVDADGVTVKDLTVEMSAADVAGWQGVYGIQVYDATGVVLDNVTALGGDRGILANGSDVTLTGTVNIGDNEFGGIEVSKGSGVGDASLTVNGTLSNDTEEYGNPAIVLVHNDDTGRTPQGTVTGNVPEYINYYSGTEYQTHYFLSEANLPVRLTSVTPVEDEVILGAGESFVLTVTATGSLSELEIDHNISALPEFSVYAGTSDPYGGDESAFDAAGVTVTYDEDDQTWTIDLGSTVTETILENGGITFYLVVKDNNGYHFGTMFGTTAENTFVYTISAE